eukprot:TRINITY_DN10885_c0_g1_i1.p2 TRINITY_DN10885_c0_g1~~TRINITY_DN10885_c0_g1_i1.p2  ORF type:complete len:174 (+),score=15.02 TRINITY_DN10885_c0_g1_i1:1753-2274(+)
MLMVAVVLLNTLIAILSDSYERIQDRAKIELLLLRSRVADEVRLSPISNMLTYTAFLWQYMRHNDIGLKDKLVRVLVWPLSLFVNLSALLGAEPRAVDILRATTLTNPVHLLLFLHTDAAVSGDQGMEWHAQRHKADHSLFKDGRQRTVARSVGTDQRATRRFALGPASTSTT